MRSNSFNVSTRRGFTLMEMLIVTAVIIVLVALIVPGMSHLKRQAMRAAATSQLNALQTALGQYHDQFNQYPVSRLSGPYGGLPNGRGGVLLAQALVGFLNGDADGAGKSLANPSVSDPANNGFRLTKITSGMGGKIYGPYTSTEPKQYRIESDTLQYFIDPWGKEILYYRSNHRVVRPNAPAIAKIFNTAADIGTNPAFFTVDDCLNTPPGNLDPSIIPAPVPPTLASFYKLLGTDTANVPGGSVKGADSYLLISAGPDTIYFTRDDIVAGKQ
jgi:prepilin-type N-terminal cleavage/methylation domain-containing protein